ncbi:unnamed protein product [Pipistrellus nathusii]|uniref:Uncharacterized protein n=1 Tax=Pipistrellus nathusii TaxID=59473 RepID=A0ABP0A0J9_PIPNA
MQQLAFNNSIQNVEKAPRSPCSGASAHPGAQNGNRWNEPSIPFLPRGLCHQQDLQVFPEALDSAMRQQRPVTASQGWPALPEGSALRARGPHRQRSWLAPGHGQTRGSCATHT